jgi:hypothetical protein
MSSYDGNFRYGRAVERYVFWNIRPQEIQSVQIFHLDHGCAKFPLIEPSALDKRDLWRELTAQIYSNMAHKERRQDLRIPGYPHDLTDSIADQTYRIVTPGE